MDHAPSHFPLCHPGKKETLVSPTDVIYFTLLCVECRVKKNFDNIKIFYSYETPLSPGELSCLLPLFGDPSFFYWFERGAILSY